MWHISQGGYRARIGGSMSTMIPSAVHVASTMCAYPPPVHAVATLDGELCLPSSTRHSRSSCVLVFFSTQLSQAHAIHRFHVCQAFFSPQLSQAQRTSSITMAFLAVALVVGGAVRLVESGSARWRLGNQGVEI